MENIIKQGYLNSLMRGVANAGSMQKRYYILYGATTNSQARLDYYEHEDGFRTDPKCRKTIYLEEVKQMKRDPNAERPNSFIINMARGEKKTYHFAAGSEFEMMSWLKAIEQAQIEDIKLRSNSPFASLEENNPILVDQNAIYESAEEFQVFNVEIQETEAAKRCNLKIGSPYELYVLPEVLCLVFKNRRIITWDYKHIRRYGCGDSNFTFEAGRKSLSGEGLFSFSVQNGSGLFRTVQEQMKHLQRQKKSDGGDEFGRLLRGGPPSLPARNHPQSNDDTSPTTDTAPRLPERRSSGGSDTAPNFPLLPPKPKAAIKPPIHGKGKLKEKKSSEKPVIDKPTHIAVLDAAVQNELTSKLGGGGGVRPPMLKARGSGGPVSQAPPVAERTSSVTPKGKLTADTKRVSTGEQYELAKSKLPASEKLRTPSNYTKASESRVLEPNYVHRTNSREAEHDYADYDITGSLRYQPNGSAAAGAEAAEPYYHVMDNSYCEATFPDNTEAWERKACRNDRSSPLVMYDTPADAEAAPAKMSDVIARLNNVHTEPSPNEYDHIGIQNRLPRVADDESSTYHIYQLPS